MEVIQYDPKYKEAFIKFNTDWITDNFGFKEIKLNDYEYVRGDIAFEKWL